MRQIRPCDSKNREIKPCDSDIKEINNEQGTSGSNCLALEQGYRSKSAYKLLQMDKQLKFLKSAKSVLDLCAAPGSWMQVALDRILEGGFVLGVDHLPIRPIPGAISLAEDITTAKCRAAIARQMRINGFKTFDVVLFDGFPNVVGRAKAEEAMTTLVINSIKIATEFLSPGGTLVTKIFGSQEINAVINCLGHLFRKVEVKEPSASQRVSEELYIVGQFLKASLEIHPCLFDVKYIFDVEHENRNGEYIYGDPRRVLPFVPAVRRNVSASTFLWSKSPRDILNRAASLSFDNPYLKDHSLTTDKVKLFCKDLLVLGKQEFDLLLEWRMHMLKSPSSSHNTTPKASFAEDEIKGDADLISERQAKDKSCQSIGMQIDALEDGYAGHEMSSFSAVKGTSGGSAQKRKKRRF